MADLDMEKQGYSGFERFLFFVTPILFTLVLLGVLLTIFNFDLRNKLLTIGHSIPFLEQVLPDPVVKDSAPADPDRVNKQQAAQIEKLSADLKAKEGELQKAAEEQKKQADQVKELQGQIDQLQRIQEEKQRDDEQYQANINDLANMYAKITPSKAAPILQSMEAEEAVLVLSAMRPDDRVRIIEKMNPKTAADLTLMLKDNVTAKDRQIAALQAQIKKQNKPAEQSMSTLNTAQLKETFSRMNAKNAGELLLKMSDVSPSKVLRILNAVDDTARSAILAEMSAQDKGVTAQLVSKLMTGK